MGKFHVEMYLIVEAKDEDEAQEIAEKLINIDLPKQLEDKIVEWGFDHPEPLDG